ncbi:MAG TPA: FkbM family methyltransferase [Bryobacteraceae bacterium]|nr:FkbM family methyltransferase [Bryobacteraceae bacterium]
MNAADYTQQDLFWSGAKDVSEIDEAIRCLPMGGVMFDLGANFGYYAITLASRLHGACLIYALEPNPSTMRRFERNIALNGIRGVIPLEVGLSDQPGFAQIVETPDHSGAAYLRESQGAGLPTISLDLFCEQNRIDRLDLIKMDIEGAELRALHGAVRTLRRLRPPLLIELNPETSEREGYSIRDVVVFLEDLGYAIFDVRSRARITRHRLPRCTYFMNAICKFV